MSFDNLMGKKSVFIHTHTKITNAFCSYLLENIFSRSLCATLYFPVYSNH